MADLGSWLEGLLLPKAAIRDYSTETAPWGCGSLCHWQVHEAAWDVQTHADGVLALSDIPWDIRSGAHRPLHVQGTHCCTYCIQSVGVGVGGEAMRGC